MRYGSPFGYQSDRKCHAKESGLLVLDKWISGRITPIHHPILHHPPSSSPPIHLDCGISHLPLSPSPPSPPGLLALVSSLTFITSSWKSPSFSCPLPHLHWLGSLLLLLPLPHPPWAAACLSLHLTSTVLGKKKLSLTTTFISSSSTLSFPPLPLFWLSISSTGDRLFC